MHEQLRLEPGHEGGIWHHKQWPPMSIAHWHEELELNIVLKGAAAYLVGRNRVDLTPNVLLWLFPEPEHILVDQSPDFEMWILVFRPGLLQQVCSDPSTALLLEHAPEGLFCRRLSQPMLQRLGNLCQEMLQAQSETMRFNLGLGFLLLSAWSAYQKANEPVIVKGIHPAVAQTVHLLLNDLEKAALPELAQRVGLSPSRLSRLFQQQTGMSLTAFRNQVRVRRVTQMVDAQPVTTLLEIALQAGFGSYAQFHRVFKQVMGASPRAYFSATSASSE
jgi:AraC-like DNA-binding protein